MNRVAEAVVREQGNNAVSAAFRNQADQGQMVDHLFSDERVQLEIVKLLGRALFRSVREGG